jgi:hypothetical protein
MEWRLKWKMPRQNERLLLKEGLGQPYAKIILQERRDSPTDRRTLHTFIANDQRSGIADRRKNHYQ